MSAVVLMYHRVATPAQDPYGLAVQPTRFAEHVEHLAGLECVVPLSAVLERGTDPRIAITFDDGYADNATVAAPLLTEAALPATYFITTAALGGRSFWWDRLATAFLGAHHLPPGVDVCVDGRPLWVDLHDDAARATSLRFLHRRLRPLPPEALERVVADLLERLHVPGPPPDELSMTTDQLTALAAGPLVEIGAHTRTHLQLAGQPVALQREEVLGSVADLAGLLGRPVTSFAYPFGTRRAVGDLAPRLAQEAGCELACSTEPGPVPGRPDRYRLPRLNVRNWTAAQLDARLRQVMGLR